MSYAGLLINTVDLIDYTKDVWQEPTEVVIPNIKCRIMYANQLIRDFRGEEVTSFAKLFFLKGQALTHTMKVRIIDPDNPALTTDHPIIKIRQPQDSVKLHHIEVWIS